MVALTRLHRARVLPEEPWVRHPCAFRVINIVVNGSVGGHGIQNNDVKAHACRTSPGVLLTKLYC